MRLLLIFISLLLGSNTLLFAKPSLKFGIFAYNSKSIVLQQYQPVVDYLNANLRDDKVEMVVLGREEFERQLQSNGLDVITTNPSQFEIIRNNNMFIRTIATTKKRNEGILTDSYGGVIFTAASNDSINKLEDLKSKSIASMDDKSLAAYQAPVFEFSELGIDVTPNLTVMKTQDEIIDAVMKGKSEAGFVRTGIIELAVAQGGLKLDDVKIINSQKLSYYPYLLSTRLYPEWPVAILPRVNEKLANELTILLLGFESSQNKSVSIGGFTLPHNYSSVEQLIKSLNLPPYHLDKKVKLKQLYKEYQTQILAIFFIMIVVFIAIIKIMRLNLQIHSNEERFSLAIEGTQDGLFDWNMIDNGMVHSKQFETMLGYSGDELPSTVEAWDGLLHPEDKENAYKVVQDYLDAQGKEAYVNIFRMRAKDGSWRWMEARGKALFDKKGVGTRFVGFNTDVTDKKESALLLEHAAKHDLLTNLPNRYTLAIFTPNILANATRHKTHVALLFIDLDGFKEVNDNYGHAAGDQLLKEVSRRMQELTRANDIVARMGGDEFVMLVCDLNDRKEIINFVSRMLEKISNPYLVDDHSLNVSASVGVSFYPQEDAVDGDALLRQSDKAMYQAKINGKNQYFLFDDLVNK